MNSSDSLALNLTDLTEAATASVLVLLINATSSESTSLDLVSDNNKSEPIHLYHMHDKHHPPHRIKFFETQFDHVQTQLTFAFWFFTITMAKIVFQRFENVKGVLPDSALLLVLGSIFGGIFHFVFPGEEIYLQPDWFFLYFLPPIALDAGYFMPNKEFFQNIGAITTFAVVGTLFNITTIGMTLFMFRDYFQGLPSTIDLFLFATLISAVDPVAVICVFEEVHVNQLLFICVFGESLLNDAVLYHTLNAIAEVGADHIIWSDYIFAVVSFFWVSFGGISIGVVWAILTGAVTKWAETVSVVQPLTCLLFPYLAYLCAESLGLSGILAIVVCGMLMKQYVVGNISEHSKVTVDYFMKTLSSSCEAVIFVFLGLSAVSKNHVFDLPFVVITLFSCLVYRFIGVGLMTYFLNQKRMQKINVVDQFIMGYGGIRGAVCYGLVMSLSMDIVGCKHMFATTSIIVICFTVFVQGGTIKKLVTYLKVKQHEVYKKSVFEMIGDNVINHVTGGIEGIAGLHGEYWMRMTIERFNDTYIKSYIMVRREAKAMKIVKHNEEIQVGEAVTYLKQHGSFAGMPTVQSKVDLCKPTPQAASFNNMNSLYANNGINHRQICFGLPDKHVFLNSVQQAQQNINYDSIPRNRSISGFVREKLDEMNLPVQTYSRHYLYGDTRPSIFFMGVNEDAKDDLVSDDCYKTYPYSKSSQKDLLILNIRKASRSNAPGPCLATACAYGCNGCNVALSGGNCPVPLFREIPQFSSPSRESAKPKFMITSDVGDFEDGSGISIGHSSEHSTTNGTTYSIGRFEVGSESSTPVPGRKLSGGLPFRTRVNGSEDISIPLLTIVEQDEQHTHHNAS